MHNKWTGEEDSRRCTMKKTSTMWLYPILMDSNEVNEMIQRIFSFIFGYTSVVTEVNKINEMKFESICSGCLWSSDCSWCIYFYCAGNTQAGDFVDSNPIVWNEWSLRSQPFRWLLATSIDAYSVVFDSTYEAQCRRCLMCYSSLNKAHPSVSSGETSFRAGRWWTIIYIHSKRRSSADRAHHRMMMEESKKMISSADGCSQSPKKKGKWTQKTIELGWFITSVCVCVCEATIETNCTILYGGQ